MSAPDPEQQKKAWETIDELFVYPKIVWVIHYSCESFDDRPDGSSPRITSIAVRNLDNAQTKSFSIHRMAECEGVTFADIEKEFTRLEKQMLDKFFEYVKSHQDRKYLHWNMRDAIYGFAAIEHRYEMLKGEPFIIINEYKYDLSLILIDIYGTEYIGHPRMKEIIKKNRITDKDFLDGQDEAEAFKNREFKKLHLSTLRKVDALANIADHVYNRSLKTNTSWWKMHVVGKIKSVLSLIGSLIIKFLR